MINAPTLWTLGSLTLVAAATAASWGLAGFGETTPETVDVADGTVLAQEIKDAQANVRSFVEDQQLVAEWRTEKYASPQAGTLAPVGSQGDTMRVAIGGNGWIQMDMDQRDRMFGAQLAAAEVAADQAHRDQIAQRRAFASASASAAQRVNVQPQIRDRSETRSVRLRVASALGRQNRQVTETPEFVKQIRRDRQELNRLDRERERRNRDRGRRTAGNR
ncbi:MAG: hypothetical protein AB8G96_12285 [Phycisphaerales bacterium]